jgi:hypothetical protein
MVAESGQAPAVQVTNERQVLVLNGKLDHQSARRHLFVTDAQEAIDTGV